jgi:hypothetical protein
VYSQESQMVPQLKCCLTCHRVLQLYKLRYQALVFKSDNVSGDLFKLKCKLVNQWDMEDLRFLIHIYKNSKKEIDIKAEINKLQLNDSKKQRSVRSSLK